MNNNGVYYEITHAACNFPNINEMNSSVESRNFHKISHAQFQIEKDHFIKPKEKLIDFIF